MFSNDVISLFADLLNSYQLPANHPQFDELAKAISQARVELASYAQKVAEENKKDNK